MDVLESIMSGQMQLEWDAWKSMCTRMKEIDIDINDANLVHVHHAIKRWGEELVLLRGEQEPLREEELEHIRKMAPIDINL